MEQEHMPIYIQSVNGWTCTCNAAYKGRICEGIRKMGDARRAEDARQQRCKCSFCATLVLCDCAHCEGRCTAPDAPDSPHCSGGIWHGRAAQLAPHEAGQEVTAAR